MFPVTAASLGQMAARLNIHEAMNVSRQQQQITELQRSGSKVHTADLLSSSASSYHCSVCVCVTSSRDHLVQGCSVTAHKCQVALSKRNVCTNVIQFLVVRIPLLFCFLFYFSLEVLAYTRVWF